MIGLNIDDFIDVKDAKGQWYEAVIVGLDFANAVARIQMCRYSIIDGFNPLEISLRKQSWTNVHVHTKAIGYISTDCFVGASSEVEQCWQI